MCLYQAVQTGDWLIEIYFYMTSIAGSGRKTGRGPGEDCTSEIRKSFARSRRHLRTTLRSLNILGVFYSRHFADTNNERIRLNSRYMAHLLASGRTVKNYHYAFFTRHFFVNHGMWLYGEKRDWFAHLWSVGHDSGRLTESDWAVP